MEQNHGTYDTFLKFKFTTTIMSTNTNVVAR
jgi:hypothetical protein